MILSPKHFYQIASGAFTVILCKETSFISTTVAATKPEFIYSTTESIKQATTIGEMSTTIAPNSNETTAATGTTILINETTVTRSVSYPLNQENVLTLN